MKPRIEGTGDTFTFEGTAAYPGGEEIFVVAIAKVVDGKVARVTSYFAPPFGSTMASSAGLGLS